ncbi:MAG: cupin domain-containing protein [Sphingobium sp.]|nr:cupin domain-containing protein [Sphingobium sp.]
MSAKSLNQFPVHLGLGGAMTSEPEFGRDMNWYMDYAGRHASDGADGRLVCVLDFTEDWKGWERHPAGGELVYCIAGTMTLHQEMEDGSIVTTRLLPGQYAINPPGIWHTADIEGEAQALFITAGMGTENRPR